MQRYRATEGASCVTFTAFGWLQYNLIPAGISIGASPSSSTLLIVGIARPAPSFSFDESFFKVTLLKAWKTESACIMIINLNCECAIFVHVIYCLLSCFVSSRVCSNCTRDVRFHYYIVFDKKLPEIRKISRTLSLKLVLRVLRPFFCMYSRLENLNFLKL
jgi:hypothetical protein